MYKQRYKIEGLIRYNCDSNKIMGFQRRKEKSQQ